MCEVVCYRRSTHCRIFAQSITHALYDLAANPEYIQPLRDEILPIIAEQGWTKAAMGKMWKLDSFLKESQRVNGVSLSKWTISS